MSIVPTPGHSPDWPGPRRPQQLHLDIRVDDADAAEREVLALGAKRLPGELFADPAGHPFCLVFGRHAAPPADVPTGSGDAP